MNSIVGSRISSRLLRRTKCCRFVWQHLKNNSNTTNNDITVEATASIVSSRGMTTGTSALQRPKYVIGNTSRFETIDKEDDQFHYDQLDAHIIVLHNKLEHVTNTTYSKNRQQRQQIHLSYRKTTKSSSLLTIRTDCNDGNLPTSTTNKEVLVLSPPWLWCNDPTYIHNSSGQHLRTHRLSKYYSNDVQVHSVQIIEATTIFLDRQRHHSDPNRPNQQETAVFAVIPISSPGSLHSNQNVTPTSDRLRQQQSRSSELLHVVWSSTVSSSQQQQTRIDSYYDVSWLIRCRRLVNDIKNDRNAATTSTSRQQVREHGHESHQEAENGRIHVSLYDTSDHPGVVPGYNYIDLVVGFEEDITNNSRQDENEIDDHNGKIRLSSIGCYALLDAVFQTGAALVQNVPATTTYSPYDDSDNDANINNDHNSPVAMLGQTLSGGRISHGQLYGDVFHVRDKTQTPPQRATIDEECSGSGGGASDANIAYTTLALCPHQDLAYYESIPGLQLLHCIENDINTIQGGASTLIDAIAAATEFQALAPDLFDVLVYCEATFIKQRDGADMIYRRPHFHYSESDNCVTSVRWSPPFEGPLLSLPAHMDDDYYIAYTAFERMIDNSIPRLSTAKDHRIVNRLLPHIAYELETDLCDYARNNTWEYRLQCGDLLVFNNQRMLHGRRAYTLTSSSTTKAGRHLMGCYTNIDDTLNQYRLLRRMYYQKKFELPYLSIVGNGSSSVP